MDVILDDLPFYKRWFFSIANFSLIPTIVSAIGFAYIAIPKELQITIRHWIPEVIREHLLMIWSADTWLIALLIISVICLIWGGLGSYITSRILQIKYKKLSGSFDQLKLEHESKTINTYKLFSNWLYSYSTHLNFTNNERISLYKLDMDMFLCIGRYSENELFNSKPKRLYPKNQGAISRAWEDGTFNEAKAPDPISNMSNWVQYNVDNFNFLSEELSAIRMKSRSFYGIRLKNTSNVAVAVVFFESLNLDGLPFGKIKRLLNDQEKANLAALVDSLEEHIPTLKSAREEGF